MQRRRGKNKAFRVFVIGLTAVFVIAVLGMLLYPFKDKAGIINTNAQQLVNGEFAYFGQFRLLSQIVTVDNLGGSAPTVNNILPLEHQDIDESEVNAFLEQNKAELVIPAIDVHGEVVDGVSPKNMNRGFWHYPISGVPGDSTNTIIIGHRFLHVPPARNTFYNLDKVEIGHKITLTSDNGEWTYIVTSSQVVDKYDTSVLNLPKSDRLVLITCHPLWTSRQRLVIIAKPEVNQQYI